MGAGVIGSGRCSKFCIYCTSWSIVTDMAHFTFDTILVAPSNFQHAPVHGSDVMLVGFFVVVVVFLQSTESIELKIMPGHT